MEHPKWNFIQYIIFRFIYGIVRTLRYFNRPEIMFYDIVSYTQYQFEQLQHELDSLVITLKIFDTITGKGLK